MQTKFLAFIGVSLMNFTSAQYSGEVFFDTGCPNGEQSEHIENFAYQGTNLCWKQSYGSKGFKAKLSGNLVGVADKSGPNKFGGCPTSGCDSGCQTVDTNIDGSQISVDCVNFSDAPYLYIGN